MNTKPLRYDLDLLVGNLNPGLSAEERSAFTRIADDFDARREYLRNEPPSSNRALAVSENGRTAGEAARAYAAEYRESRSRHVEELRRKLLAPPELDGNTMAARFVWERAAAEGLDAVDVAAIWDGLPAATKDALLNMPAVLRKGEDGGLGAVAVVSDELREREMRARRPELARQLDGWEESIQRVEIVAGAIVEGVRERSGV